MKIFRFLILIPIILVAVIYYSCDDSGVHPIDLQRGVISFSQNKLKQLNPNIEGAYELWLRLDSLGSVTDYSLGRFNIDGNGNVTDTSGGTIQFKFQGDTSSLGFSTHAFVTVEPPGDDNGLPSSAVLLSGQVGIGLDSLYASLKMSGSLALGTTGQKLLTSTGGMFIVNTPTSSAGDCLKGIWFCDTMGNSTLPPDLQMSSSGWVYEGWVMDKSVPGNPIYYSTGRFTNPYGPDNDGAGCGGTGTPYPKPGQDWVQANCPSGLPQIQNLSNDNYEVFITIEPSYESPPYMDYQRPFFVQLFKQTNISSYMGCRRLQYLPSLPYTLPEARLKITY